MRTFIALSAKDSRELILSCLIGSGMALTVMGATVLMLQAFGQNPVPATGTLMLLSGVAGATAGLVLFLRRRLWEPLHRLIRSLPRRATQKATLVINGGIAPVRLLTHRVNRLLDQFQITLDRNQREFNGIAHDLRGPLTRLLLRLEMLKEQDRPDAELIAGLDADLKALIALDQDLGELAEPQGRNLHREWLNLEPCCQEVSTSYNSDLVIVAVDPQLRVLADRRMLQRTLHNLIENALEYGGAPVKISASVIDEALVISVEDSGVNGRHPARAGFDLPPPHQGLGLAIARGFCLSHEGTMELGESTLGGWHVSLHLRAVPMEKESTSVTQ